MLTAHANSKVTVKANANKEHGQMCRGKRHGTTFIGPFTSSVRARFRVRLGFKTDLSQV